MNDQKHRRLITVNIYTKAVACIPTNLLSIGKVVIIFTLWFIQYYRAIVYEEMHVKKK